MLTLSDILGQMPAINWLSQTYAENRLPHGLIFSAPPVSAKRPPPAPGRRPPLRKTQSRGSSASCGKCPACTIFATDNHPDLHIIYKELIRLSKPESVAKDLAVDVMRDYLLIPAGRKPNMGAARFSSWSRPT